MVTKTRPEEIFGVNAGKVWHALKNKGPMTARDIAKETNLKITDVYGALGWLGREGKIEIIKEKKKVLYRLTE
ncbi:MAG: winged helix-turn-helix domain-containing protein [Sulfolobales archaeon]